ncbi:hypothetical protein JTE90_025098 [Oedothorax gibbosus]|uniref:Uncharacterized protein n=1 Tax=Oedothorax gibbosus TaxID=931172 RepID=A0AAV6TPP5_9ARAC|nr:hypothetical protein JTE90_025098 [Oedothorax gibbosus]
MASSETKPDPAPSPGDLGTAHNSATISASTSPRSDTMWSPMFCPSQASSLPTFEYTLGTLLRKSFSVDVTVDPPLPGTGE